jgi:hypothetical protein
MERLSAIHFSLLGHEIGHIYSQRWLDQYFSDFLKNNNFENLISETFTKKFSSQLKLLDESIQEVIIKNHVNNYLKITKKIFNEILADIYGTLLFGESMLIAMYIYASRKSLDSMDSLSNGYLSWRIRLKIIKDTLDSLKILDEEYYKPTHDLNNILNDTTRYEIRIYEKNEHFDFLKILIEIFEKNKDSIFKTIKKEINNQLFCNFIKKKYVDAVIERLKNQIIPNTILSEIDNKLFEEPIEFRNILYGTWLYLFDQIKEIITDKNNIQEKDYEKITHIINLLSIKGIELSTEQMRFNNDTGKN